MSGTTDVHARFVRHGMVRVRYGMVWYGMVWYGMVWYGMVWYGMVWYGMVWYGMVWYGITVVVRLYVSTYASIQSMTRYDMA